jgi:hypothetical protein
LISSPDLTRPWQGIISDLIVGIVILFADNVLMFGGAYLIELVIILLSHNFWIGERSSISKTPPSSSSLRLLLASYLTATCVVRMMALLALDGGGKILLSLLSSPSFVSLAVVALLLLGGN